MQDTIKSTQAEVKKLISSLTTLSNLVIIYLFIKWSYEGLDFLIRSLTN
jgi:hypothetical protein